MNMKWCFWMQINSLPQRRSPRLPGWDYSTPGAYFVTVCTKNRRNLFAPVGADSISARMVERIFLETIGAYRGVEAPKYVVMPNHFHAIITIERADMESAPTIPQIMQTFKRHTTLAYIKMVKANILPPFEGQIWQRSYHDHVIRDAAEYERIWTYIDNNPARWQEDCFYCV